jgi:DNA polymerase-3 subunit chi
MKQVDFYLIENQVNNGRFKLASRLAKKLQTLQQSTLLMVDDEEQLEQLDQTLWTFSDTSFVAHDRKPDAGSGSYSKTHIAIERDLAEVTADNQYDVLITLTDAVPRTAEKFARIAEIIEPDEASRTAGRARFKVYKEQEFELKTHRLEL